MFLYILSEESTVSADSEFSLEDFQNDIYEQLPSAQRRLPSKDQEQEDAAHWNRNQPLKMLPLCIQEKRTIRDKQNLERCRIGYWASWKRSQEIGRRRLRKQVERLIFGLLLWKSTLHNIEGRFGVGVKAYFVFLRYLLFLNFLNCAIIAVSVLSPNLYKRTDINWNKIFRENVSFVNIFLGSGFMEHTPIFYGFYTNRSFGSKCLNTALLFFVGMLIILLLNLVMIVRRTVVGYKNTWLTGITFTANMSYKVFCGWDFCIREPEAALINHNLIRNELKMDLEEQMFHQKVSKRSLKQKILLYTLRIVLNFVVLCILGGSICLIYFATNASPHDLHWTLNWLSGYFSPITITVINFVMPHIFSSITVYEDYSLTTQLNVSLVRSILLKLGSLTIYLIFLIRKPQTVPFNLFRCCDPSRKMFRTTSSSVLFHFMLLLGLIMSAITLGININLFIPGGCGPFQDDWTVYNVTDECVKTLPYAAREGIRYMTSEAFAFMVILAEIIVLTSYVSRVRTNRKVMERLKDMLVMCSSDKRYLVKHHATLLRRQKKTVKRSEKVTSQQMWRWIFALTSIPVQGVSLIPEPNPPVLYEGAGFNLSCTAKKGTHLNYSWFQNEREVTSPSTLYRFVGNMLTVDTADERHAGSYICMARNMVRNRTRTSSSKKVTVMVKKHLAAPRLAFTLFHNGSSYYANISCRLAYGSPPVMFQLLLNEKLVGVQHLDLLEAWFYQPVTVGLDIGTLRCIAENDIQQLLSNSINLEVAPVTGPAHVQVEYLHRVDSVTAAALLQCQITAGTFPVFLWLFNGSTIPLEANSRTFIQHGQFLVITHISVGNLGYYSCRARDSFDSDSSWVKSEEVLVKMTGLCAMWVKAGAWIILDKLELTGPSKSLAGLIEEFYCKLDNIQTNETVLYQLFNDRNLIKAIGEYSSHSKERAKFPALVSLAYDGRLICKASVQNSSDISPTFSNWMEFQVLVPVEGANIISTPSSEDLWERDSLTLRCSLSKGTYVSYEWFLNDKLLHYNSNELNISSLSSQDSGKYVCAAKNNFNETEYFNSTSEESNVHVKEYLRKPEISFEVIKNAKGNFSTDVKCQVTKGSWPITFTFFRNNQNITAVTSDHQYSSLTVPIVLDQDMGTVYCQASNGKGQLQSRQLNLTVESVGGTVTMRLDKAIGQDFDVIGVWLYCSAERGTFPQYYWFLDYEKLESRGSFYTAFHQDHSGLIVMLYPHSGSNGFYHCEAVNSFDNTTKISSRRTLIGHEALNKIPVEVAAIVFTAFSLLICAVLACCIYGAVLQAYIEDMDVVQASMMKDSDESEEEEEEDEEEEEN
ncbi:Transmembrane channel-like protein 7 [Bagarius yarrelli]|uniref:Transmembrane channel-like protein 7 n=1 Tax=Bagarius yarrelli TaxID=175774 RepID=A0A556U0S0_BAGYA|nr:Transmembrane channel-like protein 7 [Bagarius yarrelli]